MTDTYPPRLNICRYKIKPGKQAEMEALLARHWKALRGAGLVTDRPSVIYRGLPSDLPGDQHGASGVYIEMIEWINDEAPNIAHQIPEVMAVWEPMGAVCELMEFPDYELIEPDDD